MELEVTTVSGIRVRLTVERDERSVHQVFAYFVPCGESDEKRVLCTGWRVRKTERGLTEGVSAAGDLIEIARRDWERMVALREDLRDRDNLEDIHLVKIHSKGNLLTIDGYTLSARVDGATWHRIEHCMEKVDSSVNDELLDGDHFIGWVIKAGMESEVERILGVKPGNRLPA
jgi:hypothetical protein